LNFAGNSFLVKRLKGLLMLLTFILLTNAISNPRIEINLNPTDELISVLSNSIHMTHTQKCTLVMINSLSSYALSS
jgi:hypothetical protein